MTFVKKNRLLDLDIAIGISIILVVYGHLLLDDNLPRWYVISRKIVYKFHMPLFMFFSGFLMSYSYKKLDGLSSYKYYIKRKIIKFGPVYILFSFIFIGFESISSSYSVTQLKLDVIEMLIYPSKAPAGFLWYIYILLEFYLVFPLLKKLVSKSYVLALIVAVSFQFLSFTNIFNLDLFSYYMLFVVLGIIATEYLKNYNLILKKLGWMFVAIFIATLALSYSRSIPKVFFGLVSIPAVNFIALKLSQFNASKHLADIGKHSYYIYLMNTLIIGAFYLMMSKVFNLELSLPIILLFFILGLFLPMVIYQKIIKPNRFLNKIIK